MQNKLIYSIAFCSLRSRLFLAPFKAYLFRQELHMASKNSSSFTTRVVRAFKNSNNLFGMRKYFLSATSRSAFCRPLVCLPTFSSSPRVSSAQRRRRNANDIQNIRKKQQSPLSHLEINSRRFHSAKRPWLFPEFFRFHSRLNDRCHVQRQMLSPSSDICLDK